MEEEDAEATRRAKVEYAYSSLVGMLCAVSWSYLLQIELDPRSECPARHCWWLVSALVLNTIAGVLYIPYIALTIVQWLGRYSRALDHADEGEFDEVATEEHDVPSSELSADLLRARRRKVRPSRYGLRRAAIPYVRTLATDTAGSYWSVTASSALYYLINQLEFVASGGESNFVRPVSHAGTSTVQRHFEQHRLNIMGVICAVCCLTVGLALWTMVYATKRLAGEWRPYWVEVWLLLRSQLYYTSAYAVAAFLGLLFFAPFELAIGSEWKRFAVAILRAVTFLALSRELARKIRAPPSDAASENYEALASWRACCELLTFKAAAVVAAIGVHDAVVFFVTVLCDDLTVWRQAAVLFAYASALLVNALLVATKNEQATTNTPLFRGNHVNDGAFYAIFERWLVVFAWWVPYKLVMTQIWLFVKIKTRSKNVYKRITLKILDGVIRLLWGVVLALSLTLGFAFLTALVVVAVETCQRRRAAALSYNDNNGNHVELEQPTAGDAPIATNGRFQDSSVSFGVEVDSTAVV